MLAKLAGVGIDLDDLVGILVATLLVAAELNADGKLGVLGLILEGSGFGEGNEFGSGFISSLGGFEAEASLENPGDSANVKIGKALGKARIGGARRTY